MPGYNAEYARRHYEKNKAKYLEKNRRNKARQRARLKKILEEAKAVPCMDCGRRYPSYVMDLDHRDGEEKTDNVSYLVNQGCSDDVLITEIKKCDPVCANCHRERTHRRRVEAGKITSCSTVW